MSLLRYSASMSLDGFVAGPGQSTEHPLGVDGERLHLWMRELAAWRRDAGKEGGVVNASTAVYEQGSGDVGAIIMGRNMFGGGPGPWGDPPWNGWRARSRRSACPSSSSPTIRGRRSNAAVARRSRS